MHGYIEPQTGIVRITSADLLERTYDLPLADKDGYHRAIGRGVRTANASMAITVVPGKQRSPIHSSSADHLLLGLVGVTTFASEGVEHTLGEGDLLFIGADVMYEYWNPLDTEARLVDVLGRAGTWPPVSVYP